MNGNGNGHEAEVEAEAELELEDLTEWVVAARRGLRRDVAELVERLERGELYVPLARPVPGAAHGTQMALDGDLTITPHMLADEDGHLYCALFTRADILEPLSDELGWLTADGPLEYVSLPAKVGLDLALQLVDEETVMALVLNAGHESELMLQRAELGSIASGRPVPLVGYVRHIPLQDFEKTLIADGDPPPADFVKALEGCLADLGTITRYEVRRTFNADRDLEPHLTLNLVPSRQDVDFEQITERLVDALRDLVPPPGYIDIVFDRTPEAPN